MSTLQVSTAQITTLSDGSNSTSSTNAILGSAKAWVNFNGTTSPGTIRASFNVSSVTKNATGDYTVNFTNALADANYAIAGAAQFRADMTTQRGAFLGPYSQVSNSYSTGSIRIQATAVDSNQGIYLDCPYLNVTVFR
jgi:hypothetical protein